MTLLIIWCIIVMFLKATRDRSTWGWSATWLSDIKWLDRWRAEKTPFDLWHMVDGIIIFFPIAFYWIFMLHLHWLWLIAIWVVMYPILFNILYHAIFPRNIEE